MLNKYGRVLAVVLILQTILFYAASRGESTPLAAPLSAFPATLGPWQMAQEGVVEKEEMDVLRADDVLTRLYVDPADRASASLFIAYFRTQRTGQAPHSPKNCLPGSGWQPEQSGKVDIPVGAESIHVNRYLVSNGDDQSLVIYWYQSQSRVIADEFAAKFYLVADSIRKHRSDTALIRVVVPASAGQAAHADEISRSFVQAAYPVIKSYLPQ
ncbi:MAG TPA: EpsI family protein [Bryobacteraceae bacterium]|nr:EpsI family protein [Bryobacteraceae bacterium]